MKQAIFNVGGALATYCEFDNKKLIVDIGKSSDFNPVTEFLVPLFKRRGDEKTNGKYKLDQLIISHPHDDHISAIEDFNNNFYPELLTCPNDNAGMADEEKINWDLFEENPNIDILKTMCRDRKPPLKPTSDQYEFIFYLKAKEVEDDPELSGESYCNNISIATYLDINGHGVFLPGDLQKLAMTKILDDNYQLRYKLKKGVDVLICPHHGLKSSFSTDLFAKMKSGKTTAVNIVSEKPAGDDGRVVDTRYSSCDYCAGANNLGTEEEPVCQIKTSRGHIFISYENEGNVNIEILTNVKDLIAKFI